MEDCGHGGRLWHSKNSIGEEFDKEKLRQIGVKLGACLDFREGESRVTPAAGEVSHRAPLSRSGSCLAQRSPERMRARRSEWPTGMRRGARVHHSLVSWPAIMPESSLASSGSSIGPARLLAHASLLDCPASGSH
jgi:hypothetical protein